MDKVKDFIIKNNLIKAGEIVAVGVSGGTDSMALLNILNSLTEDLDFEVVAIHVDHSIRENSSEDAHFVVDYCKQNGIRAYKFKVEALKIAQEKSMGVEEAAREARYGVFQAVIQKGIADKIAIAHHMEDQAETILFNLFRGTGISGAKGMTPMRDGIFIRPLLNISKQEILDYINQNEIPIVEDYTNADDSYARNYIRLQILPKIKKKWPNITESLCNFAQNAMEDDEYINSQVFLDALIVDENSVKIPTSYFFYPSSIVTRMIFKAFHAIDVTKDIERRHIEMIKNFSLTAQNGNKIDLPFNVVVYKEYDYITFSNQNVEEVKITEQFKVGKTDIQNFGAISVQRVKDFDCGENELIVDCKKVPKNAVWRFKEEGDQIQKLGNGTVKLKKYLTEKKVPLRLRNSIPVLAVDNEVYVVVGIGISEKVKIDESSTAGYKILVKKNKR